MAIERLTPEEAWARMGAGACYLDLRPAVEFEAGHPAGAFNVVWHEPGVVGETARQRFLDVVRGRFAKEGSLIVACAAGLVSAEAAACLAQAGYRSVSEVPAGYAGRLSPFGEIVEPGWRALGLPTDVGRPAGRSWSALSRGAGAPGSEAPSSEASGSEAPGSEASSSEASSSEASNSEASNSEGAGVEVDEQRAQAAAASGATR